MADNDIPLKELLKAIDNKDRGFYDRLTEDQKKKFSGYLALRWASVVKGDSMVEHYYTVSTNAQTNRDFWDLNKHPKLQWLLVTCASPGIGQQRHEWIGASKSQGKDPTLNALAKIFPDDKLEDLEVFSKIITEEQFLEIMKDQGLVEEKTKSKNNRR